MTDLIQATQDLAPYFVAAAGGAGTALAAALQDRLAGVVVDGFFARIGQDSDDAVRFDGDLTPEEADRILDSLSVEQTRRLLHAVDVWRQYPTGERDSDRLLSRVREQDVPTVNIHQSGEQNVAAQNLSIGTLYMGPGTPRTGA